MKNDMSVDGIRVAGVNSPFSREKKEQKKMSIVPLMFRDWWEDMDRPVSRIWDQYFGRGLNRDDLISEFSNLGINRPFPTPFRSLLGNNSTYYRPWRTVTRQNSGGSSTIKMEKDNFQTLNFCAVIPVNEETRSTTIPRLSE
ncbi:hypothetical protein HZH66_013769 [Vespula vulgaris]|uniref:Uncharacterized protein n=1 Tax=Vespula vulgaris TaxID=7454 RepID=A0A834MQH3_VESVU|nr:hypothetical protein HZH66_013769 [Vespula vulgaris]